MKKALLIGGIIAAVGLLGCGSCFYFIFALTQPMIDASDRFLSLLGEGKSAAAYQHTAAGLRSKQSEPAFSAAVKTLGLNEFASVSWSNRKVENNNGLAEGTITTKDQATKAVSMKLVKEDGEWKVVSLAYGGVQLTDVKPPIPEVAELRKLTLETMLEFNQAVKSADFTAFFAKTSAVWKQQSSPDKLKTGFQVFIDSKADITGIKDLVPEFRPDPLINANGLLEISGHYPTRPFRVNFTLRYHNDPDGWKIVFMDISMNQ